MKIMMFNGLLLFLLFMWTSAETGPETELTEEIQVYANESRVSIQARKRACENLGGKCIKKKKDCPSRWHLETKPGKPYCSKNHRCCYPGPSCNLVWNYKEERPLIMIRDSKTIVPPVLDIEVSDYPSRIPIGRKLIFACPGANNQFNHVEGTHTKLHGECISHEQFKVCVNSNLVKLNLSQLSCSRKMHPSFIKDNATSDKNSCDGIGGEPYKQGYTYGDKHEFKDLEIEVCFSKKNQTALCTSPNLNGNETDYRNAIKELPGRDTRMLRMPCGPTGCQPPSCTVRVNDKNVVGRCSTKSIANSMRVSKKPCLGKSDGYDCWCWIPICGKPKTRCQQAGNVYGKAVKAICQPKNEKCYGEPETGEEYCDNDGTCHCCIPSADCSEPKQKCKDSHYKAQCQPRTPEDRDKCINAGGTFVETNDMCEDNRCGCCIPKRECPYWRFIKNHVCNTCKDETHAVTFSKERTFETHNTVFSNAYANNNILFSWSSQLCLMNTYVKTWDCVRRHIGEDFVCELKAKEECCKGTSTTDFGHLDKIECKPLPTSGDCKDVNVGGG